MGARRATDRAVEATSLLGRIPYFAGLEPTALTALARDLRLRSVAPGEHVMTAGEPCEGLCFVVRGQVRLVKTSAEGREHVLRVLGPGATFNDAAVFDGGPNSDDAVAVGETTVAVVPRATMMALVAAHAEVATAALRHLSTRQRALGHVIEDLALRDVTARVARLLLGCIGHHDHIVEKAESACARITHQEIAAMVGSVREVVQRALKELERDGAITIERARLAVRDPARLERWASIDHDP